MIRGREKTFYRETPSLVGYDEIIVIFYLLTTKAMTLRPRFNDVNFVDFDPLTRFFEPTPFSFRHNSWRHKLLRQKVFRHNSSGESSIKSRV